MRGIFEGIVASALLAAAPAVADEAAVAEPMAGLWRVTWTGTINATRNLRIVAAERGFSGRYEGIANSSVFEGRSLTARGRTLVFMTQTLDQGGETYHSVFSGVLDGDVMQGAWHDVAGGRAEIVMRRVPARGNAPVGAKADAPAADAAGSVVAIGGEPVQPAAEVKPAPEEKGKGKSAKKDDGKQDKGEGGAQVVAADTAPPAPAGPTCESVLVEKGHPAGMVGNCRGAESACAIALLRAGHHPSHLSKCDPALPAGCLLAVIKAGHHPSLLSACRGADEACAVTLLERGDHPSALRSCRR